MGALPDRPGLSADGVRARLAEGGWRGPQPVILATTGSTNAEIAGHLAGPEGTCVVAEEQTAGRGRHDRAWASPARAGLWMSVLIHPADVATVRWGWLPLVAGLAVRDAVRTMNPIPLELKWPNDLVIRSAACGGGLAKVGGILSEVLAPDAVVVGIGINVSLTSAELPTDAATSLLLEGGETDRDALLAGILLALRDRLAMWRTGDPALARDYLEACATIGRTVEVHLPGDGSLRGPVTGIDADGHLVVEVDGVTRIVTAGDVIHATI